MPCSKRGQSGDLEYKKIIASPAGKVNRNSPTKNALGKFSSDGIFPPRQHFGSVRRRDIQLAAGGRPGGAGVANAFENRGPPAAGRRHSGAARPGRPAPAPRRPFGGGGDAPSARGLRPPRAAPEFTAFAEFRPFR